MTNIKITITGDSFKVKNFRELSKGDIFIDEKGNIYMKTLESCYPGPDIEVGFNLRKGYTDYIGSKDVIVFHDAELRLD